MPKYWGKQMFSLGSFSEVGQKQKTEKKERTRERLNDGNNNGQLRIANATSGGAHKAAWANVCDYKSKAKLTTHNNSLDESI